MCVGKADLQSEHSLASSSLQGPAPFQDLEWHLKHEPNFSKSECHTVWFGFRDKILIHSELDHSLEILLSNKYWFKLSAGTFGACKLLGLFSF